MAYTPARPEVEMRPYPTPVVVALLAGLSGCPAPSSSSAGDPGDSGDAAAADTGADPSADTGAVEDTEEADPDTAEDTATGSDGDPASDTAVDTDPPDPCALGSGQTPVDHDDLGTVEAQCLDMGLSYPAVFATSAEAEAAQLPMSCGSGWFDGVNWTAQRVVLGGYTYCGTDLRAVGQDAGGAIEIKLYGYGCGAPLERVHAVALPAGTGPVTVTICEQDLTPYP